MVAWVPICNGVLIPRKLMKIDNYWFETTKSIWNWMKLHIEIGGGSIKVYPKVTEN